MKSSWTIGLLIAVTLALLVMMFFTGNYRGENKRLKYPWQHDGVVGTLNSGNNGGFLVIMPDKTEYRFGVEKDTEVRKIFADPKKVPYLCFEVDSQIESDPNKPVTLTLRPGAFKLKFDDEHLAGSATPLSNNMPVSKMSPRNEIVVRFDTPAKK